MKNDSLSTSCESTALFSLVPRFGDLLKIRKCCSCSPERLRLRNTEVGRYLACLSSKEWGVRPGISSEGEILWGGGRCWLTGNLVSHLGGWGMLVSRERASRLPGFIPKITRHFDKEIFSGKGECKPSVHSPSLPDGLALPILPNILPIGWC